MSTLGQRVRYARERRHLSRAQLALQAQMSESTIKNLEYGHHTPSHSTVVALAAALEVPMAQLLVASADALAGLLRHTPVDVVIEALVLAQIDLGALVSAVRLAFAAPETRYA